MTDDELDTFVRLYGCGTKLKREVMRHLRWRDVDWYRNWPTFGARLEAAARRRSEKKAGV